MKRRLLFLVITFLMIVLVASFSLYTFFFYNNPNVMEKKEIGMRLVITSNPYEVRFGNSTQFIDFGVALGGQKTKAHLTITNTYDKTVLIAIEKMGELSTFVKLNQKEFLLKPNQSMWVLLEATLPEETRAGEYTGSVIITQSRI